MNHSQNSTQAPTTFEDLQQHMDSFDAGVRDRGSLSALSCATQPVQRSDKL